MLLHFQFYRKELDWLVIRLKSQEILQIDELAYNLVRYKPRRMGNLGCFLGLSFGCLADETFQH
jgi:hypothetical protein